MHSFVHKKFLDYAMADFDAIKRELQAVDWKKVFSDQIVEQSWLILKDETENLEHKHIPARHQSAKKDKPIWMAHKALKAVKRRRIKRRRRVYNKYRDIKHPAYVGDCQIREQFFPTNIVLFLPI